MTSAIVLLVVALSVTTLWSVLRTARRLVAEIGGAELALAATTVVGGVFTQTSWGTGSNGIRLVVASSVFAACFLVIVGRHRTARPRPAASLVPPILGFTLWLWMFTVDTTSNHVSIPVLGGRLIPGLLWAAIIMICATGALSIEAFAVVGAATLALVGLALPVTPHAWHPCTQFKCPSTGELLAGPFASENYLAMQAVFIGVLATIVLTRRTRLTAVALATVLVYATGSRTSLYIFLACAVLMAVSAGVARLLPARRRPIRFPLAVLMTAGGLSVGFYLLFTATPHSFSNRGAIWMQGLAAMHGHALTGTGNDRWTVLLNAGLVPDHFTHSLYLLLFFAGGAVGVAIFAAWAISVMLAASQGSRTPAAHMVLPVALLGIGLTEVVWNPLTFDSLSWAAIAVTACGSFARRRPTPSTPPPTAAPIRKVATIGTA